MHNTVSSGRRKMKEKGYSKKQQILATVAVCFAGYGAYSDSVIYPIVSAILEDFPGTSVVAANMFLTGASAIAAILAALLTGILLRHIRARVLIILGTITFFIGGVAGFWAQNFSFLIVMRALDGFSDGLLATASAAMITQIFAKEKERSRVFSLYIVASLILSVITGSLSGVLCTIGWRYSFLANSASFIPIILAIFFLPDTPLESTPSRVPLPEERCWKPAKPIWAIAMYLIFSVLAFVCSICSSFYVTENGIGNSMLVGFSQSSGKIICIVVTFIFPIVYGKFKKYIPLASAVSFTLIYFFLYFAPSAGMLFLGMVLLNVGMSLIPTYYQLRVSQNTPACRMGLMMGLYTISIYGANLVCPYVPIVLQFLPGCDTYTATYLPIGMILGVLATIYLIRLCTGREQKEMDNYGQNI